MYYFSAINDFKIKLYYTTDTTKEKRNEIEENILYGGLNSRESAISRSKRRLREYAECNSFTHFVTITYDSAKCDRYSYNDCVKNIRRRLKTYKQYNKDFIYLIVFEEHTKGGYHLHGLFGGINSKDLILFREEDFEKLPTYITKKLKKGEKVYYLKQLQAKTGYCTLTPIKDKARCTTYISKYMTKHPVYSDFNYLYFNSKGLKRPYTYPIEKIDFSQFAKQFHTQYYNGDYVKSIEIDLHDLTVEQYDFLKNTIKELPDSFEIYKIKLYKKWEKLLTFKNNYDI